MKHLFILAIFVLVLVAGCATPTEDRKDINIEKVVYVSGASWGKASQIVLYAKEGTFILTWQHVENANFVPTGPATLITRHSGCGQTRYEIVPRSEGR